MIKRMMLQDKIKQQSGHLESLVVLDPCEMSSSLVIKTRSEVTPQSKEAGGLEEAEDRRVCLE